MAQRKLGALWLKDGAKGKFFSGVIETLNGDVPIVIFKNEKKEAPNHPDYVILRSEPREQVPEPDYANTGAPYPKNDLAPEDIPFN